MHRDLTCNAPDAAGRRKPEQDETAPPLALPAHFAFLVILTLFCCPAEMCHNLQDKPQVSVSVLLMAEGTRLGSLPQRFKQTSLVDSPISVCFHKAIW